MPLLETTLPFPLPPSSAFPPLLVLPLPPPPSSSPSSLNLGDSVLDHLLLHMDEFLLDKLLIPKASASIFTSEPPRPPPALPSGDLERGTRRDPETSPPWSLLSLLLLRLANGIRPDRSKPTCLHALSCLHSQISSTAPSSGFCPLNI